MEFHASERDTYGIPIIKPGIPVCLEGSEERKSLHAQTESLRQLHYTADFLEKWMFGTPLLAETRGYSATRSDQDVEDVSRTVHDEMECLEVHRLATADTIQRLLDLQRSLARYLIGSHNDYNPDVPIPSEPGSTPRWPLRAFHDRSHCRYGPLGILSSGYMLSNPRSSFDELKKTQHFSGTSLRNHCGGSEPTPFISIADDAVWLLDFVHTFRFHPAITRVAFINVKNLELMGVLHGQFRAWAMEAGGADGLDCPPHWLAYGWIPLQCIDAVWSLNDFRQVCSESGIPEGSISPTFWLGS
ncbi:hypothetical protein IMSHALPRED_009133 [Imshaugia aleurites]|uniref:DUF7587 domain-containing protein n=1 Tax=Imshaugia aleurites TaxID=172621 RepID=A0A8H3G1Y5_9LECA|nr:hypothetical protein IMSHALPRED_009133 [Imshaugia aleurites]